eukprot:NODE_69_length_23719_cov_0.556689.p2 type:complete len:620 gc:universal NODE_69_length_23719_cov_0.556689:8475-6616(-)
MRTIDWLQQWQLSYLHHKDTTLLVVLGSVVVGLVSSTNLIVLEWMNSLKIGYCTTWYLNHRKCCNGLPVCSDFTLYSSNPVIHFILYIIIAVVLGVIGIIFMKNNILLVGSGLPQLKVILSGYTIKNYLNLKTALFKSQSALFVISSGLYLSYQEVLVHTSCSIFSYISKYLDIKNEATIRSMLSVACAIGISIGFNSNMGGILFSLEEASFHFPISVLLKSFIGCFMATTISKFMNPNPNTFTVNWDRDWHSFEIPFFVILGIVGGVLGSTFIILNMKVIKIRAKMEMNGNLYMVVHLVTLNMVGYFNKFTILNPFFVMSHLFKECRESDYLLLCDNDYMLTLLMAFAIIYASTLTTYGHFPGGYYVAIMTSGAIYGRIIGILVGYLKNIIPLYFHSCVLDTDECITPGLYALIGSAAFFTGVTKLTVSTIIIMMELSGKLNYVIPMLIAVTSSKYASDYFIKNGLTLEFIKHLNYPYIDNKLEISSAVKIGQIMVSNITAIPDGIYLNDLYEVLNGDEFVFPIINSKSKFIGILYKDDVLQGLSYFSENKRVFFDSGGDGIIMRPWINLTPITVGVDYKMEQVLRLFQRLGLQYIVVLEKGEFKGLLRRNDLIKWIK